MEDTKTITRKALVAGKQTRWLDEAVKQVSLAGFEPERCESSEEVLKMMMFIPYEIVLLDEQILRENKRVLPYMVTMPMESRRKCLYLVSGPNSKTMDNLTAFSLGIDGLINYQDLNQLATFIHMLEKDRNHLYRGFLNWQH